MLVQPIERGADRTREVDLITEPGAHRQCWDALLSRGSRRTDRPRQINRRAEVLAGVGARDDEIGWRGEHGAEAVGHGVGRKAVDRRGRIAAGRRGLRRRERTWAGLAARAAL